jgi:site-specific DNA recombinase
MHFQKRAVIYCRVSTKEQVDDGNSLSSQERICKEYAIKHGYEIAETFIEKGESAKNANRTELQKLITYCTCKRNNISAVIAYKIDRVARNVDDYRYIRALLKRYDVEIKSTSEYFEDNPAGRFMENIIANVAQFDNDVRTERCMNGMRDAIREGRYIGIAPFGYSNGKIGGKPNIIQNEHADLMRRLFIEVAKNHESVDAIRRELLKDGLTTKSGKLFTKGHLYRLLKNEVYCGWIVRFGERHRGVFEPIISEELFEQVQRVLKRRSRRGLFYKRENPDFPLRRFVFHPTGKKATGYWAKGKTKNYPYYRFVGVSHSDIRKQLLDNAYEEFANRFTVAGSHIENLVTAFKVALSAAAQSEINEKSRLKAQIKELNNRQTLLIEKNTKGIISDLVLRRQLDMLEAELIEANAKILALPEIELESITVGEIVKEFLENPGRIWQKASFEQKLKLQWFEFPKGITFENGKFRTQEVASIFKAKETFLPPLSLRVDSKGHDNEQSICDKNIEEYKALVSDLKQLTEILEGKPQPPNSEMN